MIETTSLRVLVERKDQAMAYLKDRLLTALRENPSIESFHLTHDHVNLSGEHEIDFHCYVRMSSGGDSRPTRESVSVLVDFHREFPDCSLVWRYDFVEGAVGMSEPLLIQRS